MAAPIDASGLIPRNVSSQITTAVYELSVALQLGNRVPMPAGVSVVPVPMSFPSAAWVTAAGGRKQWSDFQIGTVQLQAEEVAAVIAIPNVYIEDVALNLWGYAQPLLAQALAQALDLAVLWGTNAPASFPAGGISGMAQTPGAPTGTPDAISYVNTVMALVENQGFTVTGDAADRSVAARLRNVRDTVGALVLGPSSVDNAIPQSLYGVPIVFRSFPASATSDFITGDWTKLLVGVRDDIRFELTSEGVIADATGKVLISAFQDNQTLMKVWARYGCAIMRPATLKVPTGNANPFAKTTLPAAPFSVEAQAAEPAAGK